ncbi:MAG: DUF4982 domain-containing protein, partial [Verrucomicrobia bacterium]|nr:DUF4982 domain-containing protein [Verrucomicrobiota bacterium]
HALASGPREQLLMDFGWKFHLGDDWGPGDDLAKAGSSRGPAQARFDDSSWRTLNLPHDWAIELPFDPTADTSHGFKPVGPGFSKNSVGWYRRVFTLPSEDAGRRLWLQFDGVFRDCRVFLNGYRLGHHESGYSGFRYDISDVARYGGKNVLAVRVDASEFEGWFYEGAGIYRHVWLLKTSSLAVAPAGTFIYSQFPNNMPNGPATIHVQTTLTNAQSVAVEARVRCRILDPEGRSVAETSRTVAVRPWSAATVEQTTRVRSPALWSPATPRLYKLVTTLESAGAATDQTETDFGIRTIAFDAERGFLLNGQPCAFKGTCNHQDHAGVGAALPDRLQAFRVERLKAMGCNAIRTSHNPPTPELLEACDRLGLMVMDENRLLGSDPQNLAYLRALVLRDRNHPSVVIWSIANEEFDVQDTPAGKRIAATMQRLVHHLDPTRLATYAAPVGNDYTNNINSVIDVRGWNYHVGSEMDAYHRQHPRQPEVGTEQASTLCTRGVYANDRARGYMSAYDDHAPDWGHTAEVWWKYFAARPWLSGGFVWTGFDYRGEPTPYAWPCINSHFGIMDTCGFPKDNFYYYQAWWTDRVVLHLLPHWNWPGREGQPIDVRCFSNCDEVELFLNDQSLGRRPMPRNGDLRWQVPYQPGTLSAKGYRNGQVIAETKVQTTGAPAAVNLAPDRVTLDADARDVSVITVAVADPAGQLVPTANNLVHFDLRGPGRILGVGNGDPSCHQPDTYVSQPTVVERALDNWRLTIVPAPQNRPETAERYDDAGWRSVDVGSQGGPLTPGQSAVFRTHFELSAGDRTAGGVSVHFGMIDDDGWVFVNGQPAGESHDWSASSTFDITRLLHTGQNTIAVVVRNNAGQGGINRGVRLEIHQPPKPVDWSRSVFNGLAQIIVQSTRQPGPITLTATAPGLTPATLTLQSRPRPDATAAVP